MNHSKWKVRLTVDCTWSVLSAVDTVSMHQDHIEMARDRLIVFALARCAHMNNVKRLCILQTHALAVRDEEFDFVVDGDGEEVEVDLASMLLDLVPCKLGMIVLDHVAGERVAEERCTICGDKLGELDRLDGRVARHPDPR